MVAKTKQGGYDVWKAYYTTSGVGDVMIVATFSERQDADAFALRKNKIWGVTEAISWQVEPVSKRDTGGFTAIFDQHYTDQREGGRPRCTMNM